MCESLIAELRALAREIILNDEAIKSMIKACANEMVTQELEVPEKEYYSLSDLAEVLKVNTETVRKNYISQGLIAGFKKGKSWHVTHSEFQRVKKIVETKGIEFLRSGQ